MLIGNNPMSRALSAKPAGSALPATNAAAVIDADINNFMVEVIEASLKILIIVHFWSPRSNLCAQLSPILESLAQALPNKVRLVRVNIDQNPEIAQQFRIQSVPTVYAMLRGQPVDGFQGAMAAPQVKQWLEKILQMTGLGGEVPDPMAAITAALQEAEQILAAGDWQTAQDMFGDVLGVAPDNAVAYAGVVRSMVSGGHYEPARTMLGETPKAMLNDAAIQAARAGLELAEQAAQAGSSQELEGRVAQNPADHQARYDLALALLAANQREAAVDHLLEIVRQNRSWNEDAARQQLVKLFTVFGATDPLTISARKRLSSLLFT